jgi:hypothetical protein
LDRALLWSFGFVPLLFMPAMGLLFGSELQLQWGTAFVPFTIPAVIELWAWHRGEVRFKARRALIAFAVLQTLLLTINMCTSVRGPEFMQSHHWHRLPTDRLAQSLGRQARGALGGPIRVVDGPGLVAEAMSARWSEHPLVVIDGNDAISPWLDAAAREHCPRLMLRQGVGPVGPDWRLADESVPGLYWRVTPPRDTRTPCRAGA